MALFLFYKETEAPEGFENQHSGKKEHKEPAQITSSHSLSEEFPVHQTLLLN